MRLRAAAIVVVLLVSGAIVALGRGHERAEDPWLRVHMRDEAVHERAEADLEHIAFDRDALLRAGLGRGGAGAPAVVHHAGGRRALAGSDDARGTMSSVGEGAGEPTIGVSRSGAVFFNALTGHGSSIVMRSRDDGRTWQRLDANIPGVQDDQPTLDPYLYVDPRTGDVFNADLTLPCSIVGRSHDDGATWTSGRVCAHADHQTVFAGPAPAGTPRPEGTADVVYWCALDEGLAHDSIVTACSRSRDGGASWQRTAAPAFEATPGSDENGNFGVPGGCGGVNSHGRVGPDGTIYLPRGLCHDPYLGISHDQGDTWQRVKVNGDLRMAVGMDDMIVTGQPPTGGVIDHEGRVAIDPAGNVYYLWIAEDHRPWLAISRDGGTSFGKPRMVGFPGIVEAWGPAIEAGDVGRIAISYLGTSNSPGGPFCVTATPTSCETADGKPPRPASDYAKTSWNGYVGVSVDALASDPTFTTASINDPADPLIRGACKSVQCQAEADFHGMAIAPDGTAWTAFVDGCPPGDSAKCGAGRGVGVAGRLLDAPPLFGTLAEQKPVVEASAPSAADTPRACAGRRQFTLRVRRPKRARIRSVRVTLDGRALAVRRRAGRHVAVVDLRGRPAGVSTVRVTVRTSAGRVFRTVRRYRTCAGA